MVHLHTPRFMLFHLTSSMSVRRSPRVTIALFKSSSIAISCALKSAFDSPFRLATSNCILKSSIGLSSHPNRTIRTKMAHSCLRLSISDFMVFPKASTSRRKAASAVLIAADSFRCRSVISVRSSDRAARKRYACCIDFHTRSS